MLKIRHYAKPKSAIGIRMRLLGIFAKTYKRNQVLAEALYDTTIHEARILATPISEPKIISINTVDKWVHEFNSWDLCDKACSNVFVKTSFALQLPLRYRNDKREYLNRCAYVMIAYISVHLKKLNDNELLPFLKIIKENTLDDRNFVKKAAHWALRTINKRNAYLMHYTIKTCNEMQDPKDKTKRWVATQALKELKKK